MSSPAGKVYIPLLVRVGTVMLETASRFTTFALYQLTVLLGIVLLPVALAARRVGVTLPVATVIEQMDEVQPVE